MKRNLRKGEGKQIRVELKYCEHCGSLWVREGGAGVYCEKCLPKVADLPIPKRKQAKAKLPVGPHSVAEDYASDERDEGIPDLEAVGGAA